MKINRIISQSRRDFSAEYICEHCGNKIIGIGYDDNYFHESVIPALQCQNCGETADESYRALTTKYPEGQQL